MAQATTSKIIKKAFSDPIHGTMEFHPTIVKVMNTKEFQRLRDIKQLGMAYHVYPAASHNRFEHCLGTCYLAGILVRHLKNSQPDLLISEDDILSVELAGLCHDLGHGPFSHLYDDLLKEHFRSNQQEEPSWTRHEWRSCDLFEELIQNNNLRQDIPDPEFIKYLIDPAESPEEARVKLGNHYEMYKEKLFLAEIVSNKRNGVDVDKFDYLARDCYLTGLKSSFEHQRFMKFMKVLPDNNSEKQLCTIAKEMQNVCELFHVRTRLHSRMCCHPVNKVLEVMVSDAFFATEDKGGLRYDRQTFAKLTDHAFLERLQSGRPSSKLLQRIQKRDLYKRVGKPFEVRDDLIAQKLEEDLKSTLERVTKNIAIKRCEIRHGQSANQNIDGFKVYQNENSEECEQSNEEDRLLFTPLERKRIFLLVMYKGHSGHELNALTKQFNDWSARIKDRLAGDRELTRGAGDSKTETDGAHNPCTQSKVLECSKDVVSDSSTSTHQLQPSQYSREFQRPSVIFGAIMM